MGISCGWRCCPDRVTTMVRPGTRWSWSGTRVMVPRPIRWLASPGARCTGSERSGAMMTVMQSPTPFARTQQVALGGGLVYAGAGDSYEVEVYRTDRPASDLAENQVRPERLVRLPRPNRPVTGAAVAEFRRDPLGLGVDDNSMHQIVREHEAGTH